MVKNGYFLLALLLLTGLVIVCGCTGVDQSADTKKAGSLANSLTDSKLRIVTEEFPPFNYAGSDGKLTGQATDVVKEILARQNQKADIEILPWNEGYELALFGPSVALFSTGRTEERENLFKWAGPVPSFDYTLYAKNKTDLSINSLEAAKKEKSVGVVKDDARQQFLL
ncbi:MAG: transporter substrate-binding domain-containing protein, partial [Methanomicrobium sp.]|nr:transporter substrate-binding domain-containing protein [Methanomicrobium sp.]